MRTSCRRKTKTTIILNTSLPDFEVKNDFKRKANRKCNFFKVMKGTHPEAKGAVEPVALWAVRPAEETLLSIKHTEVLNVKHTEWIYQK